MVEVNTAERVLRTVRDIVLRPFAFATRRTDIEPVAIAERLYADRRQREAAFPDARDLFHDPIWDILLDLFIATENGRMILASGACVGAAVPRSTAFRALLILEARKMVRFEADPRDRQSQCVVLSESARFQMKRYLRSTGPFEVK